jgi:hypothetical protein
MLKDTEYVFEIVEPNTPWCKNIFECQRRNKHNVPLAAYEGMMKPASDNFDETHERERLKSHPQYDKTPSYEFPSEEKFQPTDIESKYMKYKLKYLSLKK